MLVCLPISFSLTLVPVPCEILKPLVFSAWGTCFIGVQLQSSPGQLHTHWEQDLQLLSWGPLNTGDKEEAEVL